MLKNTFLIAALILMSVFALTGCKKSPKKSEQSQSETAPEKVKTIAEHQAQADQQINKENMAEQLEKIEKELKEELDPNLLKYSDDYYRPVKTEQKPAAK